jgi:hypothetical protein
LLGGSGNDVLKGGPPSSGQSGDGCIGGGGADLIIGCSP